MARMTRYARIAIHPSGRVTNAQSHPGCPRRCASGRIHTIPMDNGSRKKPSSTSNSGRRYNHNICFPPRERPAMPLPSVVRKQAVCKERNRLLTAREASSPNRSATAASARPVNGAPKSSVGGMAPGILNQPSTLTQPYPPSRWSTVPLCVPPYGAPRSFESNESPGEKACVSHHALPRLIDDR